MSEQGAVGAYYDQRAQSEWERLQGNWLEYAVTRHVIDRYLRPARGSSTSAAGRDAMRSI